MLLYAYINKYTHVDSYNIYNYILDISKQKLPKLKKINNTYSLTRFELLLYIVKELVFNLSIYNDQSNSLDDKIFSYISYFLYMYNHQETYNDNISIEIINSYSYINHFNNEIKTSSHITNNLCKIIPKKEFNSASFINILNSDDNLNIDADYTYLFFTNNKIGSDIFTNCHHPDILKFFITPELLILPILNINLTNLNCVKISNILKINNISYNNNKIHWNGYTSVYKPEIIMCIDRLDYKINNSSQYSTLSKLRELNKILNAVNHVNTKYIITMNYINSKYLNSTLQYLYQVYASQIYNKKLIYITNKKNYIYVSSLCNITDLFTLIHLFP